MSNYIIGYRVKSPKTGKEHIYTIVTSYGATYCSESLANVYFGKNNKELQRHFEDAKRYVNGTRFIILGKGENAKKTNTSIMEEWRGGKLFITKVNSSKCEFELSPKPGQFVIAPTDSSGTVCLRCPVKRKTNKKKEVAQSD